MAKTIEELMQLAKNPHYQMSEEEQAELRRYQNAGNNPDEGIDPRKGFSEDRKTKNVKNKNVVPRHDVDMDTVQPKTTHYGN